MSVPEAPKKPTLALSADSTSLDITWTAPVTDVANPILGYKVYIASKGGLWVSDPNNCNMYEEKATLKCSIKVTDLQTGTSFCHKYNTNWSECLVPITMDANSVTASVIARNSEGDSARSEASDYVEIPAHKVK